MYLFFFFGSAFVTELDRDLPGGQKGGVEKQPQKGLCMDSRRWWLASAVWACRIIWDVFWKNKREKALSSNNLYQSYKVLSETQSWVELAVSRCQGFNLGMGI